MEFLPTYAPSNAVSDIGCRKKISETSALKWERRIRHYNQPGRPMSLETTANDHLTLNEVRAAIEALSDADWLRIEKIAKLYSRNRRLEADDLLQTTLMRTLEGTRRCPRCVDFVRFLAAAMRSIASDDVKAWTRKPELKTVPKFGGDEDEFDFADLSPDPEVTLADQQEAEQIAARVLMLFEDDVVAQTIVEGQMEDMSADELRDLTGLDTKAYASKRRLIRRRIEKAFPNGWTR